MWTVTSDPWVFAFTPAIEVFSHYLDCSSIVIVSRCTNELGRVSLLVYNVAAVWTNATVF